jgi:hypothetical protein
VSCSNTRTHYRVLLQPTTSESLTPTHYKRVSYSNTLQARVLLQPTTSESLTPTHAHTTHTTSERNGSTERLERRILYKTSLQKKHFWNFGCGALWLSASAGGLFRVGKGGLFRVGRPDCHPPTPLSLLAREGSLVVRLKPLPCPLYLRV